MYAPICSQLHLLKCIANTYLAVNSVFIPMSQNEDIMVTKCDVLKTNFNVQIHNKM